MAFSRLLLHTFVVSALLSFSAPAQLVGTKTVNSAGGADYPSIAAAIAALNSQGVGPGGVLFAVAAGHTETAANLVITDSTASAAGFVTFAKVGNGADPLITAGPGTGTTDGIIKIAGTDYLTFDGIDLAESASNTTTTTQMEWGYLVAKANAGNGAHHVTIRHCTITLNKTNASATGIYQANHRVNAVTALTITSEAGTNSDNRYYANTIANVYAGIATNGFADSSPWALYDHRTAIGVEGANTITNFGGGATSCYGIYAIYQDSLNIANNIINGGAGTTGTTSGIAVSTAYNADAFISGNTVTVATGTTSGTVYGISSTTGGTSVTPGTSNRVVISANIVENMNLSSVTTGTVFAISQGGAPAFCEIAGNIVRNNTRGGTGAFSAIAQSGAVVDSVVLNGNQVLSNACGGQFVGIINSGVFITTGTLVSGNTLLNNSASGSSSAYLIELSGGATNRVEQNTMGAFTAGGGGLYGIHHSSSVAGMSARIDRNRIFDFQNSGTGATIHGLFVQSGASVFLTNNMVSDLRTPTGSHAGAAQTGLYIAGGGTVGAYNNTILLKGSSAATIFGTSGIYAATGVTVDLRGNNVVNLSVPGVSGGTVAAYRRSSTGLASYAAASDANNWYAGVPSARRLIFADGTNADSTLAAFQARVALRDAGSVTENPPFVNASTPPYDLHINPAAPTQLDSGAVPVTSPVVVTQDFDGDPRDPVYPDVGADEFSAPVPDLVPPTIAYDPLGPAYGVAGRALTATITDTGGVVAGPNGPRLYFRKSTDPGWVVDSSPVVVDSTYTFLIDHTLVGGGGVASGDTIEYYVAAQDSLGNGGTRPSGGAGINPPGTIPPPVAERYVVLLIPPGPAALVGPPDFGSFTAVGTSLAWAAPPAGPPPLGYRLSLGTDNPPTSLLNGVDLGGALAYDPAGDLALGTTYYWKVVPYNSFGDAAGCPVWRFTTVPDPTIAVFPYTEGFDTTVFPPYGWQLSGTTSWARTASGFRTGPGGAYVVRTPAGTAILQMPPVNLPAWHRVRFWWKDNDIAAGPEIAGHDTTIFEVSADGGASWMPLAALAAAAPDGDYHEEVVNLDMIQGSGILMRWRDVTDGTGTAMGTGLDDIRIEPLTSGVTFRVNMKTAMREWIFRPDLGDRVSVRGSFNGWGDPPFNNPDTLDDADGDSVYTLTRPVAAGSISYRFWKTARGGVTYELVPNRQADIGLVPVTLPEVLFGDDATVSVTTGVTGGWNMISRPVLSASDSVLQLFPQSVLPYAFRFVHTVGYVQEGRLQPGLGYWGKFGGVGVVDIPGTYLLADSIDVLPGWNMIGSISVPVDTASIIVVPPGIIGSSYFGYQNGYLADSLIRPGKAYWVKATAAGTIVLQSAGPQQAKIRPGERHDRRGR